MEETSFVAITDVMSGTCTSAPGAVRQSERILKTPRVLRCQRGISETNTPANSGTNSVLLLLQDSSEILAGSRGMV